MKNLLSQVDIKHIEVIFVVGLFIPLLLGFDQEHISPFSIGRLVFMFVCFALIAFKTDIKERRNATIFFGICIFVMEMVSVYYRGVFF